MTLAESEVRQGSSTKNYIWCYLNILNILVPTEEGRKPKQDATLHIQFTPTLGCTQRSTPRPWLVFQALGALFSHTAAPELQTETCICLNYSSQWWQNKQHYSQNQQCCQTLPSPSLSSCITFGKAIISWPHLFHPDTGLSNTHKMMVLRYQPQLPPSCISSHSKYQPLKPVGKHATWLIGQLITLHVSILVDVLLPDSGLERPSHSPVKEQDLGKFTARPTGCYRC